MTSAVINMISVCTV